MCTGKCCDPMNEKQCSCALIIFSAIVIALQITIIAYIKSFIDADKIEYLILSENPFYDLELSETNIENKKSIAFFDFYGRQRVFENGTKEIYDVKSFDTLLGQKFFYKEKEINYFDYKKKYSVNSGNNCPLNYKKCGILDSSQRILCLPVDEQCPLNGFGISKSYPDSKYENYEYKKVYDSIDHSEYYIYYTNNNIDGIVITDLKPSHGQPCAVDYHISWTNVYDNEVERTLSCIREVDGSITSDRYSKVSDEGINILGFYKDNGLTEPSSYVDINNYKFDLYARNYNGINEECPNAYLQDIRNDEIFYEVLAIVIRILACIYILLILVLEVILFRKCCHEKKFEKIGFAAPIFGVIYNLINIILFTRNITEYECQEDVFFSGISLDVDDQKENNEINLILSVVSLFFSLISLWMSCELKYIDQKIAEANGTSSIINEQPNSQRDHPTHNARNMHYQNVMISPSNSHATPHSGKHKKNKKKH